MKSLRIRLLLVVSAVLFAAWAIFIVWQIARVAIPQTGEWDRGLRYISHQILASLPQDIDTLSPSVPLSLPAGGAEGPLNKEFTFQVWLLPDRLVLRSANAPATPLHPSFAPGWGSNRINEMAWRTFSVNDSTGFVQVQVGKSQRALWGDLIHGLIKSLITSVLVALIMTGALWLVIGWSLRPVGQLQRAIAKRHELDLTPLPTAGLPAELAPLGDSFNRLLSRLDSAVGHERQFIADAAHELRTPLAAVQAHAQVALHSDRPDEMRSSLVRLIGAVDRGTRLTQQLLDSARLDAGKCEAHRRIDLADLVNVVVHEFDIAAGQKQQSIVLDTSPSIVMGDVDELGILVRNLLDNAIRYTGKNGRIVVSCLRTQDGAGARLCVMDDGPGVPPAERHLIFDRFFRGSAKGQPAGSGIGLSLAQRIAQSHAARIEADDGLDGRGLAVCVTFASAIVANESETLPPEATPAAAHEPHGAI